MAFCSWVEGIKLRPRDGFFMRNHIWSMQNPEKKSWIALPSSLLRVNSALTPIVDGLLWPCFRDSGTEMELSTRFGLSPSVLKAFWHFNAIETLINHQTGIWLKLLQPSPIYFQYFTSLLAAEVIENARLLNWWKPSTCHLDPNIFECQINTLVMASWKDSDREFLVLFSEQIIQD